MWIPMFALSIALLVSTAPRDQGQTYDAVLRGMTCRQNSMGSLECDYRVGRSLHFMIVGVGDKDAAITFLASSFEGDYFATVGVLHGCVIVKPGKALDNPIDFAFVSPRDGKVYRDWVTCGRATGATFGPETLD